VFKRILYREISAPLLLLTRSTSEQITWNKLQVHWSKNLVQAFFVCLKAKKLATEARWLYSGEEVKVLPCESFLPSTCSACSNPGEAGERRGCLTHEQKSPLLISNIHYWPTEFYVHLTSQSKTITKFYFPSHTHFQWRGTPMWIGRGCSSSRSGV